MIYIIMSFTCLISGFIAGYFIKMKIDNKLLDTKSSECEKWIGYFQGVREWLAIRQAGKNLKDFFVSEGISHIAIYAIGDYGCLLWDELKDKEICVDYVIDADPLGVAYDIDVYSLGDDLPDTEMVVVTLKNEYPEIKEALCSKLSCPVVSVFEVIYAV